MSLPLKVFTLEVDAATNSISPHVRYISPDNVLHDLYKILNCELLLKSNPVPNLYIDDDLIIFGSVAFAKSDDEGKLVGLERDDVHLLWDFAQIQFPKLLDFIARQRRHF